MAEFVEEQLEGQLPEMEEIATAELLDGDELLRLFKQRRNLEYKLHKRQKRLRDTQAYIQHEVGLLLLLRHRRHGRNYFFKKDRIESPIIERVLRLHRSACHRFQHELPCWLAQVRFCERVGRVQHASKVWGRMLQVFPHRVDLWRGAADWHWHERIYRLAAKALRRRRRRRQNEALEAVKVEENLADTPRMLVDTKEVLTCAELARGFLLRGLRANRRSRRLLLSLLRLEAELSLWLHQLLHLLHRQLPASAGIDEASVLAAEPALLLLRSLLDAGPDAKELAEAADAVACYAPLADSAKPLLQQRMQQQQQLEEVEEEVQQMEESAEKDEEAGQQQQQQQQEEATASLLAAGRLRWSEQPQRTASALRAYLRLEFSRRPVAVRRVRSQLEEAAKDLGATSADYWIAYLQFEEEHGDVARVGELDWRARKFLRPELLSEFTVARLYPAGL